MKALELAFRILAFAGVLLVIYAFLGKFIHKPTVLGAVVPGGISASSAMIGANTLLLLAIVAHLFKRS